jgi:hypothetical protein
MPFTSAVDDLERALLIVSESSNPARFSLAGLVFLAASLYFSYRATNNDKLDTPLWQRYFIFISLILGVLFLGAGSASAIINVYSNPIRRVAAKDALSRLGGNERTRWAIRLIPYSHEKEGYLSIDAVQTLGAPSLQYVFVGSYDDLKGYKVSDAVKMVGGDLEDDADQRVTAIIFRVKTNHIYPANARGLVQVLRKIEVSKLNANDKNVESFAELIHSDSDIFNDLKEEGSIKSWSWPIYRQFFPVYCRIAKDFQCNTKAYYSAHKYISEVNSDWSPFGYARLEKKKTCGRPYEECAAAYSNSDWIDVSKELKSDFGARIFLVDNFRISDLSAKYLISFDKPKSQVIPEIASSDE